MTVHNGLYATLDSRGRNRFGEEYPLPHGATPGTWTLPILNPKVGGRGYQLTTDVFSEAAGAPVRQRYYLAEGKGRLNVEGRHVAVESVRLVVEISPLWSLLGAHPAMRALLVSEWRKECGNQADLPNWANLSHAELNGANLTMAELSGANLSDASLSMANLPSAALSGANLSRALLCRADLTHADLSHANLSEALLQEARIQDANLSMADLSRANLSEVNASGADFLNAILAGTNLSGIKLDGARLTREQLRTARNVSQARLEGAVVDGEALSPTAARQLQMQFTDRAL